jgi:hypothetical protein
MELPKFISTEKVDAFWKIYSYTCYLMGIDKLPVYEHESIRLMEELGFEITQEEKDYLCRYPDLYLNDLAKKTELVKLDYWNLN